MATHANTTSTPVIRRTFLRGLAAVPLASLPALASAAPNNPIVDDLWRKYLMARGMGNATSAAFDAAEASMPEWARPGLNRVNHQGELSGHKVGWPALQDYTLPAEGRVFLAIRISPYEIQQRYDSERMYWGEAKAKELLAVRTEALNGRLAAQEQERNRVGLDVLSAKSDAAWDLVCEIRDAILDLAPATFDVTAAHIMITVVDECYVYDTAEDSANVAIAVLCLKGLLPHLSGEIARDAAEFVNSPTRRVDEMRASAGLAVQQA